MRDAASELLSHTAHRPWPVPQRPWIMGMRWNEQLFAHWRVPAEALRRHLPAGLELDLFDGSAWLGITPFVLTHAHLRGLPPVPFFSSFPEMNVRTYVTHGGKPGVWFFSLDADSTLAVLGARAFYFLPYFTAEMSAVKNDGEIAYNSTRMRGRFPELRVRYAPTGAIHPATAGSLDYWLTERYCLYAADPRGGLWRGDIHHKPWPLQTARATIERNTMTEPLGITFGELPLCHYAHRQDVIAWPLSRVNDTPTAHSRSDTSA